MTEREKIEAEINNAVRSQLVAAKGEWVAVGPALAERIESLLRDCAERAWRAGWEDAPEIASREFETMGEPLPADFPLVRAPEER